jgi:hypothetical protein
MPESPSDPAVVPADDERPAVDLPDPDQFIRTLRALNLTTVVIAWQEEYGQILDAPGVVYARLAQFALLAYHKPTSTLVRCQQSGNSTVRMALIDQLRAQGFTVEERNRNEVKYRT